MLTSVRFLFGLGPRAATPGLRLACVLAFVVLPGFAAAQSLDVQTASGGVSVTGASSTWSASFGNMNGLGIGTPASNVTVTTTGLTGSALYASPVNLVGNASGQVRLVLNVYVSTNFTRPSVFQMRMCYPAATCTSPASYTAIATSAAVPTEILTPPGSLGGTYTASLAVLTSAVNGSAALAGADQATLTFRTYRVNDTNERLLLDTDTLTISATSQTAVTFSLSTNGGLTVTGGPSYAVSFGSVNGLGIGTPAAGVTRTTSATGAQYATPYAMTPRFTAFASTTATLNAYVSADFVHNQALTLRTSSDNVTFSNLSKTSGSPTALTNSAASGTSVTRYLGLFVGTVNGSNAAIGAETAVITFGVVVP